MDPADGGVSPSVRLVIYGDQYFTEFYFISLVFFGLVCLPTKYARLSILFSQFLNSVTATVTPEMHLLFSSIGPLLPFANGLGESQLYEEYQLEG